MPAEPEQTGRVLLVQDLQHVRGGVCHDRFYRVHGPTETADLRDILPEAGETSRAVPVQRDVAEADGVLPVHEAKGRETGSREQIEGIAAACFHNFSVRVQLTS